MMAPQTHCTNNGANNNPDLPDTISCIQGNLRRSHQSQLNLFIDIMNTSVYKNDTFVIFITEPYTIGGSNTLLDVPSDVFNIFSEKNGRTALVTKGITSWKVPQFCSKDIIVCQTKINNKLTFLVSLYLDCKVPSLPKELIDLMRNVGNNDVLIGTDSNAHSTVWNCSSTDNRGDMVNKFLIDNNLSCCNIGNNPTFINGSGDTSIIDLTIANYRLSQRIRNWQVEKVLHSTDHFRIRYDISNCFNFRIAPVQTWNYRKGAWSYFKSLLERGLLNWTCPRSWTDASIEVKIKQFNDEVMNALDISCPKKRCKSKYKFPTWWNPSLSKMRAKMRFLAKKKSSIGKDAYKNLRREYKSAIANAKIDGWNKFTSEIDNPSDVSKLIRTFNNSTNNALGLLKNDQGNYCNNPEESLSILLEQFFPGHTDVPLVDNMEWSKVRNNKLDNTFTIKKIKNAFHRMGSYKGAGPDGLKPIVMKNFGPIALRCISFIFKAIYSTGYIPVELRNSRVVFIPKPLKTDYGEAGSFRPISLTTFYFKSMERVVEYSLREDSDKYGKISQMQHAYSTTKGTDTALSTLVNMIESCILRNKLCLVLSVDIKGAFNNLATKTIHKVLVDNKYPPLMIRWYMNFLKNRNSVAEVLGIIKTIRPICGTPQGGVLSSRIWNLAFDPLLKLLNDNSPCNPVGFADDGALSFMGIDPNTMVANAQTSLNLAIDWGAKNGLSFCPKKTTVVFFSRRYNFHKRDLPKVKKIKMGGVEIIPSSSMTYLGVILDQKLNWCSHINTKVAKAIKWLAIIKPAINSIYGLSPARMLWIYKQILLPRITYGAIVWGHSLTIEQQHTLRSLESMVFRYFAQIWKSTPTASLEVIMNLKPAHLEVLSTAIKTFIRIKDQIQSNFWDGIPLNRGCGHLRKLKQITTRIIHGGQPLELFVSDYRKNPLYNWNPPVRDQLTAVHPGDIDDSAELEEFNLVNSIEIETNQTDNGNVLDLVDATIRSVDSISPASGNTGMVISSPPLHASTQGLIPCLARIPKHVDVNSQHVQTDTTSNIVLNLHTVAVTGQCEGPVLPADGNVSMVTPVPPLAEVNTQITGDNTIFKNTNDTTLTLSSDGQVIEYLNVTLPSHVPPGTSKVVELTLGFFDRNYNLYAQRINHHDDGLFIRAILMKDNIIIINNTFKILGTSNVAIATIASADQVCNQYLIHARKGDSFICALGDGHHGVRIPVIRNEHLANFIITLNSIKVKTGMYNIVTGLKSDWLQYANHNTISQELILASDKKTINPTIESFLNVQWYKQWDDISGHAQTKYWLPRPDPFLATKLLSMSRKHLGYNIQFFSGHGWWRKHLMTAKLSKSDKCRLCLEDQAVETPIHIFSECPAMAGFRQVLFNDTYPSQHTGQQSLCQVTELALHGSVQDLIERTDQYSYVHPTE